MDELDSEVLHRSANRVKQLDRFGFSEITSQVAGYLPKESVSTTFVASIFL